MQFFRQNKETLLYLVFGILTTIVNIVTYILLTRATGIDFMIANIIAWTVSIIFAYLTNKFFVFNSKVTQKKMLIKEFTSFVGCRVFSLLIEMILMYVMIDLLLVNDVVVKIITNISVIVLNYVFSKLIIFKDTK